MEKFQVEVLRISYGFATIEVEANNEEEADAKALDEAGNHLFNEKNAEYELAYAPSREERLTALLWEIHNEIGGRADDDALADPTMGSPFAELDNCDIMRRIRKEIH